MDNGPETVLRIQRKEGDAVMTFLRSFWMLLVLMGVLGGCASKNELELFHELDQNRSSKGENKYLSSSYVTKSNYVYRFRPLDRIAMIVYGQPEFSTPKEGVLIDRRGYAPLPVVGRVRVAGLSESEASRKLQSLIRRYVVDAVVVAENPQKQVFVIGDVKRPGPVRLLSGQMAMIRAIGSAGGFRDTANRDAIYLVRKKGNKATLTRLSLSGRESLKTSFLTLIPGDIVYVAPNTTKAVNMGPMQTLGIIGKALSPFAAAKTIIE